MKIINWDKLRYKFILLAGADLAVDTTYTTEDENGKTTYCLTLCDSDEVGETIVEVFLKEGNFDEFLMTAKLPLQQITPNIKRVFRKKDLLDVNGFLNQMGGELVKNSMVNSYLTLIGDMKQQKRMRAPSNNTFSSHSINLPF
jgi:hypothetical protein